MCVKDFQYVLMLLHTKYEKAKQLTGKQHFIYSRQKFNTVFSSCLEVIISKITQLTQLSKLTQTHVRNENHVENE